MEERMTTKSAWAKDAVFYHLYPLGCLGCPTRNPFTDEVSHVLCKLHDWLDYLQKLGVNALLLGPLLQSSAHGYDVADYWRVDRRLGDEEDLAAFSRALHRRGMRLVLDAVFHHTGRDFWAFRDVLRYGETSAYRDWYHVDFSRRSPYADPFHYEGWAGHYDLAKLNLQNSAVREHLFAAATSWVESFEVDGLRLDAADRLDPDFRRALASHLETLKADFWLMGEVVHGDYRQWVNPGGLCSVTNYEAYKGLWSSHNDKNYFEIAYTFNRQFGPDGIYKGLDLFAFADNHDVDRVASALIDPAHLYPLYILLMTMPGIPSLYYGSEWGMTGRRTPVSDAALRPAICPAQMGAQAPHPDLHRVIQDLVSLRRQHEALRTGTYEQVYVAHEQFAFMRGHGLGAIVIVVNAAGINVQVSLKISGVSDGQFTDALNGGISFAILGGRCTLTVPPRWGRILVIT
jgi:cyclomaltodextrinase